MDMGLLLVEENDSKTSCEIPLFFIFLKYYYNYFFFFFKTYNRIPLIHMV